MAAAGPEDHRSTLKPEGGGALHHHNTPFTVNPNPMRDRCLQATAPHSSDPHVTFLTRAIVHPS